MPRRNFLAASAAGSILAASTQAFGQPGDFARRNALQHLRLAGIGTYSHAIARRADAGAK